MIFCFVRETKQLTLEEIDRKSHLILREFHSSFTNTLHRGLHGPNQDLHQLWVEAVGTIFHKAPHPQKEEPCEATTNHLQGWTPRSWDLDLKIRSWDVVDRLSLRRSRSFLNTPDHIYGPTHEWQFYNEIGASKKWTNTPFLQASANCSSRSFSLLVSWLYLQPCTFDDVDSIVQSKNSSASYYARPLVEPGGLPLHRTTSIKHKTISFSPL